MIDYFQAFWLALVQGVTEFLPISSSGHLVLVPALFGWPDQGLAFDVAVHVGSLIAVMAYFQQDLRSLIRSFFRLHTDYVSAESRLLINLVVASMPVLIIGFLFHDWIEARLRNPVIIALAMIGFGALLWWADGRRGKLHLDNLHVSHALFIGMAQALALIPGTSRSGITLTAALVIGFSRVEAARFSFLMSIPIILLAGMLKVFAGIQADAIDIGLFSFGIVISAISAYACIALFLKTLESIGLVPFVIYRFILGAVLLYLYL